MGVRLIFELRAIAIVTSMSCILALSAGKGQADPYATDPAYTKLTDAANDLYHKGRYTAALAKAEQALALHSGGQWAGIVKALAVRALGNNEAADALLKGLIKADPKFPEPHLYRAQGFGERQHWEPALAEMKIYSKLKGREAAFPYTMYLLLNSQKNSDAIDFGVQHLKSNPGDTKAKMMLAIGYAQDDQPAQGLKILDSLKGKDVDAYYEWRAYCEALLGLDKAARKDLTLALQNQSEADKVVVSSQIHMLMYRKSKALQVYQLICPELVRDVRRSRFATPPSIKLLEKRILQGEATPTDYRQLGDLQWQAHEPEKAIKCYDKYLVQQPNAKGFLSRAEMYASLLMDDKAVADCEQALKLDSALQEAIDLRERCLKRK